MNGRIDQRGSGHVRIVKAKESLLVGDINAVACVDACVSILYRQREFRERSQTVISRQRKNRPECGIPVQLR